MMDVPTLLLCFIKAKITGTYGFPELTGSLKNNIYYCVTFKYHCVCITITIIIMIMIMSLMFIEENTFKRKRKTFNVQNE
jgi:hypothetical protein